MSRRLRLLIKKLPGEKIFGFYRILPFFFLAGAALEFFMIKWHVGEVNFYKIYKRNLVNSIVEQKLSGEPTFHELVKQRLEEIEREKQARNAGATD